MSDKVIEMIADGIHHHFTALQKNKIVAVPLSQFIDQQKPSDPK
jgi:hypothetical protein